MYHHVKRLMYTVNIGEPDPIFGRCSLSSSAEPTESQLLCSIQSRGSIAKMLHAKTC